jgi:hypothetical protein
MGSSSYAQSNGDGTLAEQQELVSFNGDGKLSYSNGIGDFDNDGQLDFILARGSYAGIVYLYGKIDPGNNFELKDLNIDWSGAKYPAGMAVADFDEDGNLDFITTYYGGISSDFFKGNGSFGFEVRELELTSPFNSLGADAGDFNGDGHADFVTSPYQTYDRFYININDGTGNFNTIKAYCGRYQGYWDVSAVDVNNDGFDDLVATDFRIIDIYLNKGDGTSTFEYPYQIQDPNMYLSPVDNYDFDGDGNQDLVLGGYGAAFGYKGIAVRRGDGNGGFYDAEISGGAKPGMQLISTIAAPMPVKEPPNLEPVAVIHVNDSEVSASSQGGISAVTAGQDIYVDGLDSYDEDGEIVSYHWDFGDGLSAEEATAYHVYYDTGTYTITLTVTDDKGATGSAQFTLEVESVAARMRVVPRTLNLKSRGRWMYAFVKLPQGCDPTQVDITAIEVVVDGSPVLVDLENSKRGLKIKTNRWLAKRNKFYLKFDRQALIDSIDSPSKKTVIRVRGETFKNGGYVDFSAEDTIRTIKPGKKKSKHYWKNKRHKKK